MLVIRRRPGESVRLGGGIEVTVLEITSNRVKLGFVAPAEVGVVRGEAEVARRQNLAAAAGLPTEQALGRLARALQTAADGSGEFSSTTPPAGR
jgi:carbon storage regulator